jgi:tRNA (cmo5U34)-methyltransferase
MGTVAGRYRREESGERAMRETDNQQPEEMAAFFDARAAGYDAHMAHNVESFSEFYAAVAEPVGATDRPVKLLDIGAGTGLQLDRILARVPNARVTAMDVSSRMLDELRKRVADHRDRIRIVRASYLTAPFPPRTYDYVVAVMTLHHLLPTQRQALYARIAETLKPNGTYIEGDWVVSVEIEHRYLEAYRRELANLPSAETGEYHIDVPLSLETIQRLLDGAGLTRFRIDWHRGEAAVYTAHR